MEGLPEIIVSIYVYVAVLLNSDVVADILEDTNKLFQGIELARKRHNFPHLESNKSKTNCTHSSWALFITLESTPFKNYNHIGAGLRIGGTVSERDVINVHALLCVSRLVSLVHKSHEQQQQRQQQGQG